MNFIITLLASVVLTQYVNPFVGTDAHGHTFPGATYPFGMVQLSPDTRPKSGDWDGCSGYHYSDSFIYGFSHTHLSGTGCDDWCDVLMMPTVGYPTDVLDGALYGSPFSHDKEKASPGYYEVFLEKPQVLARMTVGRRSGIHQYTFPEGATPEIVIDLSHRDRLLEGEVSVDRSNRYLVTGKRRSHSWADDQILYFSIELDRPVREVIRTEHGAILRFAPKKNNVIEAHVGISSFSAENARLNALSDGPLAFEEQREATNAEWEAYLSTVECPFEDDSHKATFYTALYHTGIHPSLYSDYDGRFRVKGGAGFQASGWERYTVFSLWDTFRGLHPFLSDISPDLTVDFLNSFYSVYLSLGKLPVWELSGNETNCMIGYNSAPVVADALLRGIDAFDVDGMLEALLVSSTRTDFGLGSFRANGLVLADDEHESVSKTLEYAYDDWCVAQVAKWLMDHPDRTTRTDLQKIYSDYMTSSQYWRNVFDPSTGFMRARLNGRWVTPFDPREVNNNYTEANAWQYSFFVPHDVVGLMRALGGPAAMCARIDSLFDAPADMTGRTQVDITGQIGQYAHGNEPSHHIPYLYALAGQPEKTERRVRQIMETLYSSAPDGLCGNDDCGQMSAWYVLSALGHYPVCPGAPEGTVTYVPKTIVVNPWFEYDSDIFRDSLRVEIKGEGRLMYRIDDGEFQPYSGPLTIKDNCTVEAYGQGMFGRRSFVTRTSLHRIHDDYTIDIRSRYSSQYTAGGDEGLIDSVRGGINWRTGGWQGYQGTDFEAVLELKEPKLISEIGAGFCQDARSWIWMPQYVEYSVSVNGSNFVKAAHIDSEVAMDDKEVQIWNYTADMSESRLTVPVKYVKVFAKNPGPIPDWHAGAGNPSFIFIDEIWVK